MKNVIIPVDFSETSLNAARYAAEMLKGRTETNVILYSLFEKEEEGENTASYLDSLKNELEEKGVLNVDIVKEMGDDLIDCLDRLAFQKAATLIVMGINGRSPIAQALIGSNTLKMAEKNVCPVLIIPPDAKYNGVKNIAFTSDLKDVENTPVLFITTMLDLFKARLHVINVDSEHYISINDEYGAAQNRMKELLAGYNPEFYFMRWNSFHEAINQFAADYKIDIILTVPKYHSFLSRVLAGSNTRDLVYHSSVPVLAIHQ